MTKENEKLRDCLRDAESIITNALRSQPEGDDACKRHLTNAVKGVLGLVYDAKSQMPDGSKYAMEGMGHPSAYDRPSNAAAMREALTKVKEWMEHRIRTCGFEFSATFPTMLEDVVLPALAAPPRNCDIGSPEEQAERMEKFCNSHGHGFDGQKCYSCENCKLISIDWCELAWAQMPYQEGENDGSK